MTLECLKNYIGIIGCGLPVPGSGRYINSLPGITLESIDRLANPEQQSFLGVWEDVQTRALAKYSIDIQKEFAKRYKLKRISRSNDLGKRIDNTAGPFAEIAEYRGFSIEMTFKNTFNLVYSNFQTLYLQTLNIYLRSAPSHDITIKVFNMDTFEVLDTFTIANATQGWNTINVEKNYQAYRIFIGYDSTNIIAPYQFLYPNISSYFEAAAWDLYGGFFANGFIRGGQTTGQNPDSLAYGSNSYGLSAVFSLNCGFDQFVCNNLKDFGGPFFYLLGSELMIERQQSTRFNRWTMDIKRAAQLQQYCNDEYVENLSLLIGGIDLDTTDVCLECDARLTNVEMKL